MPVLPDEQPVGLVATPHKRPRVAVPARLVHAAAPIEGVEEDGGEAVQNLQARGQPLVVCAGKAV